MYDTLIMLKPGAGFTPDDLHRIVVEVARSGKAIVSPVGTGIHLKLGGASIQIAWNAGDNVLEESEEIAERFGIPCRGCRSRLEMLGDDPNMDLFNDYLLINEHLQVTGNFIIFDAQECKLMFDPTE